MNNINTISYNLKRSITTFSNKICKGITRPEYKFVLSMLYGIGAAQSTHLSEIARALKEPITLKKVIDRLSRNLATFKKYEILMKNYTEVVKGYITKSTIFVVDGGDITKHYSSRLEALCSVRDGSSGEVRTGYHLLEIMALTEKSKGPLPVYTRVFSSTEQGFISEDKEVLNGLDFIKEQYGNKGILTFDRGYDANTYYRQLIKNKQRFVIRAKKNRIVKYNGESINILKLAEKFKGKYRFDFKRKEKGMLECKVSFAQIELPEFPGKALTLVIIKGFSDEPMMLITSLMPEDKKLTIKISKVYLLRWRIEEYYRFKKVQYGFEDFRVRSMNSIRTLNILVTVMIGYIAMISEKRQAGSIMANDLMAASKRVYPKKSKRKKLFVFYAIADGMFTIFKRADKGISAFIAKKTRSNQLSFFDYDQWIDIQSFAS